MTCLAWCVLAAAFAACGPRDPVVEFLTSEGYTFSRAERHAIQRIAKATVPEVRRVLPALPRDLVIRVHAGTNVIPETGETATVVGRRMVDFTVNPRLHGGVLAIVEAHLRSTLFHEFHHLARRIGSETMPMRTLMDSVIHEGMATVFERDFAGADYPWGQYPEDVADWVQELMALPDTARTDEWMIRHPDGRRWIGYKAGAYLVDRAIRASGLSAAELVFVPPADVIRMAMRER